MKFDEFQKLLKGIKYRVIQEWDIALPFNTDQETIQKILDICREHLLVDWHVVYPDPTELTPEPETNMYWDRKNNEA